VQAGGNSEGWRGGRSLWHRAAVHALARLYRSLSHRRRRQLLLMLGVMLCGAAAELATIGAVLPFLAFLTRGGAAAMPGVSGRWVAALGVHDIVSASLLLIAGAVGAAIVRLLLLWLNQRYVMAVSHDIATAMFGRMLRQPYADYVKRNSSEALASMDKVRDIATAALQPLMQGIVAAIMSLLIAALLFVISPLATIAAALSIGLVYAAISILTRKRLRANSKLLAAAGQDRIKMVQEALGGIRDIILDRSQPLFEETFGAVDRRFRRAVAVNIFIAQGPRFVVEAAGIGTIALIALAMSLRPGGIVGAIPALGALALGSQRLLPLVQQAYYGWSQTAGNVQAIEDIAATLAMPVLAAPADSAPLPFEQRIAFEQVSFGYGAAGLALRDVSLVIPRGSRIGIAGTTGSGKSTLLDLLMGLLEPSAGQIRVDGRLLDAGTRPRWQASLAHVPQAIFLIDDSIAANIAFGAGRIDMERVRACARTAHVAEFVESLPDGYETKVGERGIRLSGGQRQRLGIARALYKGAKVLILDEATSALDDETEAAVIASIMALGPELTIVMIAHRRSTLEGCDAIVRLEGGRIVETKKRMVAEEGLEPRR
jgi:ABC-type multidrug transport system fused ATPase/permease subunit